LCFADDAPGPRELTVGENVTVNEPASGCFGVVIGSGDAVVEEEPARAETGLQELEVVEVVAHADVFKQADGRNGVETVLGDISVVAVANFGIMLQALGRDSPLRP